mgnify:CR=1 FL=1
MMDTAARPYIEHQGSRRQYMRDMILGVNDGLVSIFLLVAGVVGGGLTATQVLLAALAGAIAGAISMAAGEYMATKSQEEVFDRELRLEREHIKHHRDRELDELRDMLFDMGIRGDDLDRVVAIVGSDDDTLLHAMQALEFGLVESERRSPLRAMVLSGLLFMAGSLPAMLPFAFTDSTSTGLAWAAVLSGISLFIVGAIKTISTGKNPLLSGSENLAIAIGGAVVSYFVGVGFELLVG